MGQPGSFAITPFLDKQGFGVLGILLWERSIKILPKSSIQSLSVDGINEQFATIALVPHLVLCIKSCFLLLRITSSTPLSLSRIHSLYCKFYDLYEVLDLSFSLQQDAESFALYPARLCLPERSTKRHNQTTGSSMQLVTPSRGLHLQLCRCHALSLFPTTLDRSRGRI